MKYAENEQPLDERPANCRFRLQEERKAYPRSSCPACGRTITTGLGMRCQEVNLIRTTAATPQADADGWIPWEGGARPVAPGTEVEARLRDGSTIITTADRLHWDHWKVWSDIIAYRIAKPATDRNIDPQEIDRVEAEVRQVMAATTFPDAAQIDTDQLARLGAHVAGPVRMVTVPKIVAGDYGRLRVAVEDSAAHGEPTVGLKWLSRVGFSIEGAALNADEIDAASATLSQLANALRAGEVDRG